MMCGLYFLVKTPFLIFIQIKEMEVIDLPLWLARYLGRNAFVSLTCPNTYGKEVQSALQADPTILSFASGPYFYEGFHGIFCIILMLTFLFSCSSHFQNC
jgi:hypothetical protein